MDNVVVFKPSNPGLSLNLGGTWNVSAQCMCTTLVPDLCDNWEQEDISYI